MIGCFAVMELKVAEIAAEIRATAWWIIGHEKLRRSANIQYVSVPRVENGLRTA